MPDTGPNLARADAARASGRKRAPADANARQRTQTRASGREPAPADANPRQWTRTRASGREPVRGSQPSRSCSPVLRSSFVRGQAFATIQTVRQFLSVVLSIVFFAHPLNSMEAVGIFIVFAALGAQIFDKWYSRQRKPKKPLPPTPPSEEGGTREPVDADKENSALLRSAAGTNDARD